MKKPRSSRSSVLTLLSVALGFVLALSGSLPPLSAAGSSTVPQKSKDKEKDKGHDKEKESKGKKAKKASTAPTEAGAPALWEDRGDISKLNLFWGIGSQADAPKPPFQFDKEDLTGSNPKIKVIDANGVKWNIKFDEEVHAEVACSRLVWACGYLVEESYFIPSGQVSGASGLTRAKKFVNSNGSFANGMFEKRPNDIARRGINWDWDRNPFVGTKELSGLAMLTFLLNNWDAKVTNNNVLGMYEEDGKTVKDWYIVADWGGTLGKTGSFTSHSKWDLADFSKQAFIESASGNAVKFHYSGKISSSLKHAPREHVQWFAGIIGKLSDQQIRDAFKAAGASQAEIDGFTAQLRKRINELKSAAGR